MNGHNPPDKHHYLPEFLLKQWAGSDGRLCQFSQPYSSVLKAKRVYPSQTGFERRLYSLKGLSYGVSTEIESTFFKPLDSKAADAHRMLLDGQPKSTWPGKNVYAWGQFLVSLNLRMPEDLKILRLRWSRKLSEIKQDLLGTGQSSSRLVQSEQDDVEFEREVFGMLMDLNNSSRLLELYCEMHWETVDFSQSGYELYFSDRPIVRIPTHGTIRTSTLVPISPSILFVAAPTELEAKRISKLNTRRNLREINKIIVSAAEKFAYAPDDKPLRFMQNNFGSFRDDRPILGNGPEYLA